MHGAQKPTEPDVVVKEFETAPCVAGTGRINKSKQNSSHHLKNKNHRRSATKYIPPTRCVGWDLMLRYFDCGRAEPEPLLKPVVDIDRAFFQAGHEVFLL